MNIPFNGLTEILGDRSNKQRDFLGEVVKVENKFIEELYLTRK